MASPLKRKRDEPKVNGDEAQLQLQPQPQPQPNKRRKLPTLCQIWTAEDFVRPFDQSLEIFVCGKGDHGELGLGSKAVGGQSQQVSPRINESLSMKNICQVSCGKEHGIALTRSNRIITWGSNAYGQLGRDTNVPMEADDVLNPAESTPFRVDTSNLDQDVKWAQIVGSDCASFALTSDGKVFGWGTFLGQGGIIGFRYGTDADPEYVDIQKTPRQIPELVSIKKLAAGSNHVLALSKDGKVYSWGSGEHGQLGRRVDPSDDRAGLKPGVVNPMNMAGAKITKLACGSDTSFAISANGKAFSWGLNDFGQLGNPQKAIGAGVVQAAPHQILEGLHIVDIAGGQKHAICLTDNGEIHGWGRVDHQQPNVVRQSPNFMGTYKEIGRAAFTSIVSRPDHCLAITTGGNVFSWGVNHDGRTGHNLGKDTSNPAMIRNAALQAKKISFVSGGESFSIFACAHKPR
ncbi:hypothetical protein Hte_007701 [Hypoxylon texense]